MFEKLVEFLWAMLVWFVLFLMATLGFKVAEKVADEGNKALDAWLEKRAKAKEEEEKA